jgi:hypothetical protein
VYSKVGGRSHREFLKLEGGRDLELRREFWSWKVKERFGAQKTVLKLEG